MKTPRLILICLLCFIALCNIEAQETDNYRWEFGLDLTPLIAIPYATSANQPGLEVAIRRQISSRIKLRLRYFNNREDDPGILKDGFNFNNFSIDPATDGTPRSISNINYRGNKNAVSLGFQRAFKANGLRMYAGLDAFGQLSRSSVWSEILLEGQLPYNQELVIFNPNSREFTGVINEYYNYQIGVIPALGIDIPIGERINFSIEFGARIGYFFEDLPFIVEFEQLEIRRNSGLFIDAQPVKDLIITFRF